MHITLPLSFLAYLSVAAFAQGAVLLDEPFDNPNEITYSYPAEDGGSPGLHGDFSGWATQGGVISVKYGALLGTHGTGGMLCTVEKPSPEFMMISYQKAPLAFSDPTYITRKQLGSYQLEFDACLPPGRTLELSLSPQGPTEMESRLYNNRLILGKIVGTGVFKRYVLTASSASDRNITYFIQSLCDAFLNGTEKMEVDIIWNIDTRADPWSLGEYFQIDNIKLSHGS